MRDRYGKTATNLHTHTPARCRTGRKNSAPSTAISIFGSIVATGTDFAATPMGEITGGTLHSVTFASGIDGVDTITWSEIDLRVLSLVQAFEDENSDTPDIAAVENLLFPLDWDITFNDQSDFLPRSARTEDGVRVHLQGDDKLTGGAGLDTFVFINDGSTGQVDTVLDYELGFDSIDVSGSFSVETGVGGRTELHHNGHIAVFEGITISELEFEPGLFVVL